MNQITKFAGLDFGFKVWRLGLRPAFALGFELPPSTDFLLGVTYNSVAHIENIDGQCYPGTQGGLRFLT